MLGPSAHVDTFARDRLPLVVTSRGIAWVAGVRPAEWAKDPEGNQKKIAETFRQSCDVAESFGEKLAAEGEICWGGMHSWRRMVQLLEMVDRPHTSAVST